MKNESFSLKAIKAVQKATQSGLDFINVLRTAFTPVVPQSVRTQSSCQYLFMLLGPTSLKAVRRTLMKLTPDVQKVNSFEGFLLATTFIRVFFLSES
jgi:hypothetical protein